MVIVCCEHIYVFERDINVVTANRGRRVWGWGWESRWCRWRIIVVSVVERFIELYHVVFGEMALLKQTECGVYLQAARSILQ